MARTDSNGIFVSEETDNILPLHSYFNAMMGTVSAAVSGIIPPGVVVPYAGNASLTGWVMCDGRILNQSDYPDLYKAIGTSYGTGDGSSGSFNAPDLRVRVPIGRDASKPAYKTLGKTGGAESVALTIAQMPKHNHTGKTGGGRAASIKIVHQAGKQYANNHVTGYKSGPAGPITQNSNKAPGMNHWHDIRTEGEGQAHNNMQPFVVMNYIIKA